MARRSRRAGQHRLWTYVTDDSGVREAKLADLADMVNRPVADLREQVLVGPGDHCIAILRAHVDAGVNTVFVWPLADPEQQLERLVREVIPFV